MKELKEYEESEKKRHEINLKHLSAGVKFVDLKMAYIDEQVIIGKGTIIYPGVILEGNTKIGENCVIGQNSRIVGSEIGNGTEIQSSVILESNVGNHTKIGPFAYLRPNSKLGDNVKVGDFVEVKNSFIGNGSKASHLSYIGDSDVGEDVNIGCGVVFVNYDGKNKHRSVIKDGSFLGCNVNIVSPVVVEEGAYIAAGTTVTGNVPAGSLCIGRAKEKNIEGWTVKRGLLKKKK
ncbi:MAG: UDP-N-acetylglucosamine diphosphorylase [Eubacteriales bacterium]|nr:UDP-N-acetylglucosamine diphosphorylase [Eubacteriales bacterium]MDD3199456.1 UDP-N-acetylglucosamine diphosphorylase [Eubacteriales bacterium]MDD4122364.1 UDP-N-acetylglucosamine diphosphorylase [Eubacteriales bacterium]MDD4629703.1 UDP-N-acetylglucosamine diphosphorylase [Eubacteriales bacterium]